MDVALCGSFPFVVVLSRERQGCVFGNGYAYLVFVDSSLCHAGVEVVECGCEMYVRPRCMAGRPHYLHRIPTGLFQLLLEPAVVKAPMVVVVPDCCT